MLVADVRADSRRDRERVTLAIEEQEIADAARLRLAAGSAS
jgi:hypothetical protein